MKGRSLRCIVALLWSCLTGALTRDWLFPSSTPSSTGSGALSTRTQASFNFGRMAIGLTWAPSLSCRPVRLATACGKFDNPQRHFNCKLLVTRIFSRQATCAPDSASGTPVARRRKPRRNRRRSAGVHDESRSSTQRNLPNQPRRLDRPSTKRFGLRPT